MSEPEAEFMTIEEVIKLLKISRTTILNMSKKGVLPIYKFAQKSYRLKRSDVMQHIQNSVVKDGEK